MKRSFVIAFATLLFASHAAGQVTFRIGVGADAAASTTLRDADCSSTVPPAIFGCVEGRDGRALAARGRTGRTSVVEGAAGFAFTERLSGDVALAWRPDVDLDANANFPGVAALQPVTASGESLSLIASGSFDFGRDNWPLRPFVTAGAGVARNSLGEVTYAFPSIGANAVTITPGGTATDFAWTAGIGVAVPVTARVSLDLLVRHTDLGNFETDGGSTKIIRPARELTIDTAPTEAALRMNGVLLSLRWR